MSAGPDADEIRPACERAIASKTFQEAAPELSRLLKHIVSKTLNNERGALKLEAIAAELYPNAKDPNIVSVHAGRLRKKLAAYYSTQGSSDRILIKVPVGAYVAEFTTTDSPSTVGLTRQDAATGSLLSRILSRIQRRRVTTAFGAAAVAGTAALVWIYGYGHGSSDTSVFAFEDEAKDAMGWQAHRDNPDSRAVAGASRIADSRLAKLGKGALKVDLTFGPGAQLAEIVTDFKRDPLNGPADEIGRPIDLSNKVITAHLWFKNDLPIDPKHPPVARLFLKDHRDLSLYGCTENIDVAERWIYLSMATSDRPSAGCKQGRRERDPEFDASNVIKLGVSIAANSDSALNYSGACVIDTVDWEPRDKMP